MSTFRSMTSRSEAIQSRVAELVSQEQFHKACACLVNEPPVDVTTAVVASMETKHPVERHPLDHSRLRVVSRAASAMFDAELVAKIVKSFQKDPLADRQP